MKREITCAKCVAFWRAAVGKYAGEHVKIVGGTARRDFMCDGCGCDLPKDAKVYAVSVYTERTPYFKWEHEDLKQRPDDEGGE